MIWKRKAGVTIWFYPYFEVVDGRTRGINDSIVPEKWCVVRNLEKDYEPYLDVTVEELKLIELL